MAWFTNWINRIPDRWRSVLQHYGVWIVLAGSIGLAWAADSRQELIDFGRFAARKPPENLFVGFGYAVGYIIGGLIKYPHRQLPMIGVVWAFTKLHYRYLFARLAVHANWRYQLACVGLILALRSLLITGLTAWLGFAVLSSPLVNAWLAVALLYAFITYFRHLRETRRQLTEQKTRAELDALKAQINPHFLFNSLNNIFGTALTENGPRTADSVQQLARILRYMLEQADTNRASVGTELRFLDEYVLLQKQRLPLQTAADVRFTYEWDEEPAQVAPLLLSPLLDYAFRQSIDVTNHGAGFLHANAQVQARQLQFVLSYSCPVGPAEQTDELQNVRQRLNLIYPECHQFTLREAGATAQLELTINLN